MAIPERCDACNPGDIAGPSILSSQIKILPQTYFIDEKNEIYTK
jgi:hypothetical protein